MTEKIYLLTIFYAMYAIDDVIGEKVFLFINDMFHLDLSVYHTSLRKMQTSIK